MSSRMNKYYDEEVVNTRYHKNEELYKEISKSEIDNYEVKSNTTILGENRAEIDVEKIKKILDTRYNEVPKRKSIRLEEEPVKEEEKEITKEYDINVILEKAREQKTDNYEEERLKKLRDTQFDILKKLSIDTSKDEDEEDDVDSNLKNLINTIALNENISKNNVSTNTSLDILSDLKGSDDTEVLEGLKEEVEDVLEEELKEKQEEEKRELTDTKMINSFYTSSNALKDRDFEDIEDFSKSIESNNTFIKVIIGLIIVIVIIGVILFIKTLYFS